MMLKTKNVKMIDLREWDELVIETYKRPYNLQQQDGCMERGTIDLTVPNTASDFENDTLTEDEDDDEMGVSFKAWMARTKFLKANPQIDPDTIAIAEYKEFCTNIEKQVTKINLMTKLPFQVAVNEDRINDPSTETYWQS